MSYLTREQATEELARGGLSPVNAARVLDHALTRYPRATQTTFRMVTGYRKGTVMDAYYPGNPGIPADLFTVSAW